MLVLARLAAATAIVFACYSTALAGDNTTPTDINPPANPKLNVMPGDRWTYEVSGKGTKQVKYILDLTVTDVTATEIAASAHFSNADTGLQNTVVQRFDRNWRLIQEAYSSYSPAYEETGVPADIKVGKTWSYSFMRSKNDPPAAAHYVGTAKVESWERVAVANNLAFDAFKIVYNSVATPVGGGAKWRQRVVMWYAPAANRYVKQLSESSQNGKITEGAVETLSAYRGRWSDI
jgi:hypothetical protein